MSNSMPVSALRHVLRLGLCLLALGAGFDSRGQNPLVRGAAVFEEKWNEIAGAHQKKTDALKKAYGDSVGALERKYQEAGELDGVLACRAEAARPGESAEDVFSSLPELEQLRNKFRKDAEPLMAERTAAERELAKKYAEALLSLRSTAAQAGRSAEMAQVDLELDRIRDRVPGLPPTPAGEEAAKPAAVMPLRYTFSNVRNGRVLPEGGTGPELLLRGSAAIKEIPGYGAILSLEGKEGHLESSGDEGMKLDGQSFTLVYLAQELADIHSAILFKGPDGERSHMLALGYHQRELGLRLGTESASFAPQPAAESWKQVLLTYDAARKDLRIYINGKEALARANVPPLSGSNDHPLLIGRHPHRGEVGFEGRMANLRISGRAMTPTEVANLYRTDRAEMDKLLRQWMGTQPRSARDLDAWLEGTEWSYRNENPNERPMKARFRPGGRVELAGLEFFSFTYKASSGKKVDITDSSGRKITELEFDFLQGQYSGRYLGIDAGPRGTLRTGCFLGRKAK